MFGHGAHGGSVWSGHITHHTYVHIYCDFTLYTPITRIKTGPLFYTDNIVLTSLASNYKSDFLKCILIVFSSKSSLLSVKSKEKTVTLDLLQ